MPNDGNTGTPPSGTGPQGDAGTAAQKKLIAGKYETVEEAVEKGYGGLEKGFHALSEQVAGLTRLLEAAVEAPPASGTMPVGQTGYAQNPYGRGYQDPRQQIEDDINPADFITKPGQYIRSFGNTIKQELQQEMRSLIREAITGQQVVNDFKARHSDLVKHEPLVRTFMQQVDRRKPINEQLEDAAKLTREYLAKVGMLKPDNQPPQGNDYVEPPRGGQRPTMPVAAPRDEGDEQELINYINESHQRMAAHFGDVEPQKK